MSESDYPKVTVLVKDDDVYTLKVFIGNEELPFDVYEVQTRLGFDTPIVTIEFPADGVEFRKID